MRTPFGFFGLASVQSCTVSSNWGSGTCSNAGTCNVTSPARTITVPAGNSGTLLFSILSGSGHTCQYSKNGGTFTTFSDGGTLVVANGDTLALKIIALGAGSDTDTITVTDNTTSGLIGTATGTNNHA